MSHWMEARIESFGAIGVAVNPAASVGTMKPRTPSSVCAQMIATWAIEARPIHRLAPEITQSSPSRRANVVMLPGSDPDPGSVRPKQPITSPAAIRGSHWSSAPPSRAWRSRVIASEPCTETNVRRPESPASSSAAARPYSTADRPAQP